MQEVRADPKLEQQPASEQHQPVVAKPDEKPSRRQHIEQLAQAAEVLRAKISAMSSSERAELLALQARAKDGVRVSDQVPEIRPRDVTKPAPLSFSQQRLWLLGQVRPGGQEYNLSFGFRLEGTLDVSALERSFGELIRRHESLRTRFEMTDRGPVQVIEPASPFRLEVTDLSSLDAAEREASLRRLMRREAEGPFDLEHGPLFRACAFRVSAREHVAMVTIHHIISDAWSMGVLRRDLSALYTAFSQGRPSPLPALSVQYADFAIWQRERLHGDVLERQLSYWRGKLADMSAALELPTDHPRPPTPSFRGARLPVALGGELSAGLIDLGRRRGATLYMVLVAAFQLLLSRWSGQQDVVVGSPIAGRTHRQTEALIGFFVNTLVMRTHVPGELSFADLLNRVKETALGAYAHQDIPFEKLVAELQPKRDLSRQPLFQVVFALQNVPQETLELPGLQVRLMIPVQGTARFDLFLQLFETANGLAGSIEYATDLFDGSTIERLMASYLTLLEGIVADPERRASEYALLNEAERERIVVQWNATAAEYPRDKCLHELFAEQARKTPDAVAVVHEGRELSYGELDRRSNQLAHHLRGLGVGPEVVVGLCLERSLEMVVGLLGILKAGGAYLPLDPGYPADRLAYMVADAQVPVLVTQAGLINQLPAHDGRVVCLDADWAAIAKEVTQPPTNGGSAENLAYAIYTSGSTGRPKGVMVSHRNVVNLLAAMAEQPGLSRNDVLLAVTPISFDIAGLEVFLPLVAGARLALVSRDIAQDGARLRLSLEAVGATVLQATPASWRMLFDAGWQGGKVKALCGGEALPKDLARTLAATTAAAWNLYGPTETTIWSTAYHLTPDASISIGRPIFNTRTHVLDGNIEVAPIGVAGELYIGGEGVARGYLGRPGLTAERFVPSPFGCGKRLYRTGDRVRYLADGNMEFLGRRDNQVKVRGFRVEPREVEAALMQYAGVRQAVVVAREDAPGETRLVGYVVGAANTAIDAGAIRDHLREFVPNYMVPSAFVVLEALPLTPNGKLDRRALPAPEGRREAAGYVAPRTSLEEALATVWAEVLKLDRVGVHDNFFELGGHSLLAMKVCVQSRSILARSIDVSTLFSRPTIAGISEWLEQKSLISKNPARIVLRSAPAADHAICFLPSIVGYGSHYSHLARRLTTRAAIYSCRLMGTVTGETPLSNLEDIAAYCRGQLVVPGEHTKLSLVGWSFGGLLAYETSRQMTEAGIAIHRLVMLDSFLPDQIDGIDGNVVTRFARNLLGIDAARLIEHDLHDQESIKLARISEAYYRSIPRSEDSQIDLDSLFQTYKANLSALKSYQCGPYAGPLVEIHAEQSLHSHQRPSKQQLGSQKARPITLPGNHYSIITDVHVAELARILDGLF